MIASWPHVIHFLNLSEKQLNQLLRLSHSIDLNCCYLGHQSVGKQDLLLVSSRTKLSDLKNLRSQYTNWIFLVLEEPIRAKAINEIKELGEIYFIDDINLDEISYQYQLLNKSQVIEQPDRFHDETLAVVSHDLKNPLNAIRLEAQILLRNSRKEDKEGLLEDIRRSANRIIKTTDRLAILVSDLLDNDKSSNVLVSLTRTPTDAIGIVEEVIEVVAPIAKRNSIKIKKNFSKELHLFLADRNKIFQVLMNLVSNALKFSRQHTSVQISVEQKENNIYFAVEDSGPGIDREIEKNLYERYRAGKTRECGSGLGLYICKTIVEAHQGIIQHRPGKKGGTIFEFFLPLSVSEKSRNKIYLIDSDDDLREVLSWALNSEGYHVESFSNPHSVYHYVGEHTEKPALILSDLSTLNMSSQEIGHIINKLELQSVPLILLSTSPKEVRSKVDSRYFTDILQKPLDLEAFVLTVSTYMKAISTQQG